MQKRILEKGVKTCMVDALFVRKLPNPDTMEYVTSYMVQTVTFKVDDNPAYTNWTFTKLFGGKKDKRILRVYLTDGEITTELAFNAAPTGIQITKSKPKKISTEEVVEKLKTGQAKLFDNEELSGVMVYHAKK